MIVIFFEDSFDSAHWLPHVPENHKCRNMHGHTYRVRIEMGGKLDEEKGWVMDYATVKKSWAPAKNALDHHCLNDTIPNPTCELIAEWIAASMGPACLRVEVRETENCGAVWNR